MSRFVEALNEQVVSEFAASQQYGEMRRSGPGRC
jgi:ferritin